MLISWDLQCILQDVYLTLASARKGASQYELIKGDLMLIPWDFHICLLSSFDPPKKCEDDPFDLFPQVNIEPTKKMAGLGKGVSLKPLFFQGCFFQENEPFVFHCYSFSHNHGSGTMSVFERELLLEGTHVFLLP